MPDYIAPFLLSQVDLETLPDGVFIVPVCTTRERYIAITNALWRGGLNHDDAPGYAHLVDWLEAIPRIRSGCEYDPTDNCNALYPDNPRITWFPESPYAPEAEIPDGYNFHPWTIVDSGNLSGLIGENLLGFKVGDVFTDLSKIPIGSSWEDLLTTQYLNFPRFRINDLVGRGSVQIHFLNIVQGGRALIAVDGVIHLNPYANRLAELAVDTFSFPPETEVEQTIEIEIEASGTHFIDVVFLPTVDDTFIPLFFGGGLRWIELCGFDMPLIDPCCPDDDRNLQELIRLGHDERSFILRIMDDGTDPKSFAPDAPDHFDSNVDDPNPEARTSALCELIKDYVWSLLKNIVETYAEADAVTDIITGLPIFNPIAGLIDFGVDIGQSIIQGLAGDVDAVNAVICQMYEALKGEPVQRDAFRDSVDPSAFSPLSNEFQIAVIVDISNATLEHYRAFVHSMGSHYEQAAAGADNNCMCGCFDDLILSDWVPAGNTIEHVGECLYKLTQTTQLNGFYYFSFQDDLTRCLHVEVSPDPARPTVAVGTDTHIYRCVGADYHGVGGIEGTDIERVYFRTDHPVTYYKITLDV